jgi:hypothetical protein
MTVFAAPVIGKEKAICLECLAKYSLRIYFEYSDDLLIHLTKKHKLDQKSIKKTLENCNPVLKSKKGNLERTPILTSLFRRTRTI